MQERFSKKTARVLIVESNSASRSVVSDVLKSVGFTNIQTLDKVKAAFEFFESDSADWVLAPAGIQEPVNILHLLETITRFPALADIRVSAFLDSDQESLLPLAFQLGLFSWHRRNFTKESLEQELKGLMSRLEANDWNESLTASGQLQDYLRAQKHFGSLLRLVENLHEQHPERKDVIFSLARAQMFAGKKESAMKTLGRAQVLAVPGWEAVAKEVLGENEKPNPSIGIHHVMVVDSDESVHNSIKGILSKVGVDNIAMYTDGEAGFAALKGGAVPELILQEWRIPKLSGPAFLQRVRQQGLHTVPVIVVSSLLNKTDAPLLAEMSVANVIAKPVEESEFLRSIVFTLQQERNPTLHRTLERRLHQLLSVNKMKEACVIHEKLMADDSFSIENKKYVTALLRFYQGAFEESKALVIEAMQGGADQCKAVNLLGRCLSKLRDFDGAIKCFERAQALSPKNVERLCELAKLHAEKGDGLTAKAKLQSAKALDDKSEVVDKVAGEVAIFNGEMDAAREIFLKLGSLTGLVGDMNNSAVAFIRSGNFKKGFELYRRTLEALPERESDIRCKVIYNLALAHTRKNELKEAREYVEKLLEFPKSSVFAKSKSLERKIEEAERRGHPVRLDSGDKVEVVGLASADADVTKLGNGASENPVETPEIVAARATKSFVSATPGQRCCHLIFFPVEPLDSQWQKHLANPPKFRLRAAIEKAEGMGAEIANKS